MMQKNVKFLIACKSCSTFRAIKEDQGRNIATENNILFYETSA